MVKRMVGPGAVSAAALARQVGVSQPTLSQWLREANSVAAMTPPARGEEARRPQEVDARGEAARVGGGPWTGG
ncbi:hypothetical protein [Myxococcus xanthus]|uniref:hypothetical protein n=1 Tax=Myxococcus xanthus TaxID=34 RepID=UPI003AB6EA63